MLCRQLCFFYKSLASATNISYTVFILDDVGRRASWQQWETGVFVCEHATDDLSPANLHTTAVEAALHHSPRGRSSSAVTPVPARICALHVFVFVHLNVDAFVDVFAYVY